MKIATWIIVIVSGVLLFKACDEDSSTSDFMGEEMGCNPPTSDLYVLPFPVGQTYSLIQGACGTFSHQGNARYGYDFAMPVGTIVTAARSGVVNLVEEGFSDNDSQIGNTNALIIEHEDGTYSRYLHLAENGVLVETGMTIGLGDTIALSGNSGLTQQPNLHFDAFRCAGDCSISVTIPVGFINAGGPVDQEGSSYTAAPY